MIDRMREAADTARYHAGNAKDSIIDTARNVPDAAFHARHDARDALSGVGDSIQDAAYTAKENAGTAALALGLGVAAMGGLYAANHYSSQGVHERLDPPAEAALVAIAGAGEAVSELSETRLTASYGTADLIQKRLESEEAFGVLRSKDGKVLGRVASANQFDLPSAASQEVRSTIVNNGGTIEDMPDDYYEGAKAVNALRDSAGLPHKQVVTFETSKTPDGTYYIKSGKPWQQFNTVMSAIDTGAKESLVPLEEQLHEQLDSVNLAVEELNKGLARPESHGEELFDITGTRSKIADKVQVKRDALDSKLEFVESFDAAQAQQAPAQAPAKK